MPRTLSHSYDELVEKAQHLFWVEGYKPVEPEKLAKHLDVSVSTIYNKYTKEMLFMDSLRSYIVNLSDPVLNTIRTSTQGIESFRKFFYMLIDALLEKKFPRSCLIANTAMEFRNENSQVSELYDMYFQNMRRSYKIVLERAIYLGEVKHAERMNEYIEFLVSIIFSMSILYRIKNRKELRQYIDEQLSLIE